MEDESVKSPYEGNKLDLTDIEHMNVTGFPIDWSSGKCIALVCEPLNAKTLKRGTLTDLANDIEV